MNEKHLKWISTELIFSVLEMTQKLKKFIYLPTELFRE
jgi:hypothetical protein